MQQVVYTDNLRKDGPGMFEKAQDILRLRALQGLSGPQEGRTVDVLQDQYHAKMRIVKCLSKRHPDYQRAVADFGRVMGRVLWKVRCRETE